MPAPSIAQEADDELDQLAEAGERAAEENAVDVETEDDGMGFVEDSGGGEAEEVLADPVPNGSSFFDGTEGMDDMADDFGEEMPPMGDEFAEMDPEEAEEHSFAEPINTGAARLAVVGLEDGSEKDSLKGEFEEVFEAFQLGHYGNRVMHDYFLHGAEDVNPIWGLTGSALLCTVMVVYMRPDGDEVVSNTKERLTRVMEGVNA